MTERNLEIVRQLYDGWGRGDFRAGTEHYDDGIVFVLGPEFPDAGRFEGRDGVRRYMSAFLGAWDTVVIEAESYRDADGAVLACVIQRATGRGSGVPVEMRYFQLWTFNEEAIVGLQTIMDRADALEAAGLDD